MTKLLVVIGIAVLMLALRRILRTPKEIAEIQGTTIQFRERWKDEAFVEYSEPLGQTLIFDAYWASKNNAKILRVEFPTELSVNDGKETPTKEAIMHLGIPDSPSVRMSSMQRDEVKDRVSRGLTKLKIAHEFVSPQRSGWTSFEDGKEIYHG